MSDLAGPSILVVDDSPTMLRLFSSLLESTGNVVTASSGEEGLVLARQILPDLILLDVQMPGWDGFDVINDLKLDPTTRHIPVIFITGEVLPEIESHCLESGGADYIAKPITPRVLLARVKTHLLIKEQADLLAEQSFRDPMTGTLSSWAFTEILASECARAERHDWPTGLLLVEIDHFGGYTDAYGHSAADEAIVAVAASAKSRANRPGDQVARVGIPRFAVILPQTTPSEAQAIADQIRGDISARGIRHSKSLSGEVLTVSVGGSGATSAAPPAALGAGAQIALRSAQDAGGDVVRFVEPSGGDGLSGGIS